jgi:predicted metal-dependent peptidase
MKGRLKEQEIQAGGTDPLPTLELIKKTCPDLSIILTDGYYNGSQIKLSSDVIWIISEGGNKEHEYKHLGKTIPLEGLK